MVLWIVMHHQIQNPTKTWRNQRPHHRSSPLQQTELNQSGQTELNQSGNSGRFAWTLLACGAKQTAKHKARKLYT